MTRGARPTRSGRASRWQVRATRKSGQLYGYVGQRVIEEFKIRQRQRLEALCEAAGATEPGLLADALVLLIEGARVSRRSVGSEGPSANLVGSGKAVIAAFGVRPQRPTSSTY